MEKKELDEIFVPYELAKRLKQKGFNKNCFGTYLTEHSVKEGKLYPAERDCDITPEHDDEGYENFVIIKNSDLKDVKQYLAAPMYQQVIEWLLEKHKIYIYLLLDGGTKFPCWRMCYDDMNKPTIRKGVSVYFTDEIGAMDTHKEAWDFLITYVLYKLI